MNSTGKLTFRLNRKSTKSEWPITKNLKRLRSIYNSTVTMKVLEGKLMETRPYYLNEMGMSVNVDGTEVSKSEASFMWGMLKGWETPSGEQLYVWTKKTSDGKFKYIDYGTRKDFDKTILKRNINTNKQNNHETSTIV